MVNFLSPFSPELHKHLLLIYYIQKKRKLKLTDLYQKSFGKIKSLVIKLPILMIPIRHAILGLESHTSVEAAGERFLKKRMVICFDRIQ